MSQLTESRMKTLISDGYIVKKFSELPIVCQLAIVWYMAVDGEAWSSIDLSSILEENLKASLVNLLPNYVEIYGNKLFGLAYLSTDKICNSIMQDPEISERFSCWNEYHSWYLAGCGIPEYSENNLWPVILSSDGDETLTDGWHRLHSYIRKNIACIPAVFFI